MWLEAKKTAIQHLKLRLWLSLLPPPLLMRGTSVIEINTLGTLAVQRCIERVVTSNESPYPPLGGPSTGRNLGKGQGACCSLVLKTNLGPVIHKSLVYQCLQMLLCTFDTSRGTSLLPEMKQSHQGVTIINCTAGPPIQKWQALLLSDNLKKKKRKRTESYVNVTLCFYFCLC